MCSSSRPPKIIAPSAPLPIGSASRSQSLAGIAYQRVDGGGSAAADGTADKTTKKAKSARAVIDMINDKERFDDSQGSPSSQSMTLLYRCLAGVSGLIVTALCLAATPAAPAYVWKNVVVGGGGFAPAIVFSRVEPGLAYLRTDIGGLYRWDNTARTWVPLQDAMSESTYFGIESVAPHPVNANVVYAAAGMYRWDKPGAILKSADRGASWEIFSTPFRMGGNEDGRGLGERLAVDPNEPSILYFGSRHDGLQRSTNGGKSWSEVRSFSVRGLEWKGNGATH